jgi:hypothetical protein
MIPIKLTDNHYINPEAIAHVRCNPTTAGNTPAMFIFLTDEDQFPIELYGVEADEAIANWRAFHQLQK